MKSPKRPPLNLPDPEPETPVSDDQGAPKVTTGTGSPASSTVAGGERPMSERRRRQLAEEQRRAAETADVPGSRADAGSVAPTDFAVSADAPPVAYEPPA